MAATPVILSNAYVSIASTELSDHVEQVKLIERSKAVATSTVMGDTAERRTASSVLDWECEITFHQDFAASNVYAKLYAMLGSTAAIAVRAVNTTISATNPEFQGTGTIEGDLVHVDTGVGDDVHKVTVRIVCSNGTALIHDVTP